jgi:hypothetical protein
MVIASSTRNSGGCDADQRPMMEDLVIRLPGT